MCCWVVFALMFVLTGCTYGPVHTAVELGNSVARPGTHVFAMATIWKRERNPESFLATFPDGGKKIVVEREARIYVIDVARRHIVRVAQVPDFAGIPKPKSVHIEGWHGDHLYIRLFGYGGSDWHGDDMSDPRRLYFRVSPSGDLDAVAQLPAQLESSAQSGPHHHRPRDWRTDVRPSPIGRSSWLPTRQNLIAPKASVPMSDAGRRASSGTCD
jgi:hypothetical protein